MSKAVKKGVQKWWFFGVAVLAMMVLSIPILTSSQTNNAVQMKTTAVAGLQMSQRNAHETILKQHYKVVCLRPTRDGTGHPDIRVAWVEEFDNRVPTTGLNLYLNNTLKGAGVSLFYVGLVPTDYATASGVSNSTTTFTDTSNSPFSSVDASQPITIRGAGTAGADYTGTIASYVGTGTITLQTATATSGTFNYLFGCRLADTMASHSPWAETVPYSNANRPVWTGGTPTSGSVDNSASPAAFSINASATVFGAFVATASTKSETSSTLMGMGPFSASRTVLSGDTLNVTITFSIT